MAILLGAVLSSDAVRKNRLPGFVAFSRGFATQYCAQQSHHAMQAIPITVCWLFDLRHYLNQLLPQGRGNGISVWRNIVPWVGVNIFVKVPRSFLGSTLQYWSLLCIINSVIRRNSTLNIILNLKGLLYFDI